jgi:hypothetical protein
MRWRAIGLLIILLAGFFYLWRSSYTVDRPTAGPWPVGTLQYDREWSTLRDNGYRAIADETGVDPRNGSGLKLYYSWPQQIWLAFSMPAGAQPRMAIIRLSPGHSDYKAYAYTIPKQEYVNFINKFDEISAGYRIMLIGTDGKNFSYERWEQGSVTHYSGSANSDDKDKQIDQLVSTMASHIESTSH